MVMDPFVSTHRGVSENSNDEIEQVAEAIRYIAHETNCSIDLVHHSVKSHAGNSESHAGDMNAARGASALIGAVRILYTLALMSPKTATDLGVPPHLSARLIRLDQGKGNYSARDPDVRWFELVTVPVGNPRDAGQGFMIGGDTVAVPARWHPPQANHSDTKTHDKEEVKRQRVRDVVAAAMPSGRCKISVVLPAIQREFDVKDSAARNLVMEAVAEGCDNPAEAHGGSYVLTIERKEPSPPNPVFLVRKAITSSDAAKGGDGPASSNPAAGKHDGCEAVSSEPADGGIDVQADLVAA
jgi:hypothetical protein